MVFAISFTVGDSQSQTYAVSIDNAVIYAGSDTEVAPIIGGIVAGLTAAAVAVLIAVVVMVVVLRRQKEGRFSCFRTNSVSCHCCMKYCW